MFKTNEGPIDRVVRGVVGIAFISYALFMLSGIIQIVLAFFGFMLIFTAITGFCGLYTLFGINTCPIKKK